MITKKIAKRFIAMITVLILVASLTMVVAFAGTCGLTVNGKKCTATTSETKQGSYTSTYYHTVNKFLGLFGGEECKVVETYNKYATKCSNGHVLSTRDSFVSATHNVKH